MPTSRPRAPGIKVADFLRTQIDFVVGSRATTQRQIAIDCGYEGSRSNIISMFKQGLTRLPINKVGPMAKSLGIDPVYLLRMVLSEYSPETWDVLEDLIGNDLLADGEKKVIKLLRESSRGIDLYPETDEQVKEFDALVAKWGEHKFKQLTPTRVKK